MKKLLKKTGTAIAVAAMASTAFMPVQADEAELIEKLPSFIEDAFNQIDLRHGISIAVVHEDRIVYSGAFGNADIKSGISATPDTSFYIASSTKPFTGLAALLLANEGILSLDKSLAAYFPEVQFDPALMADQITIPHLIAHTHGLDNDPIAFAAAYSGNHTPESLLEMLRQSKVNEKAPFGTYEYTNLGYNIFSMIIERETGKPWQDVLAELVFKPLNTVRTSSYMSDAKTHNWPLARPYLFAGKDRDEAIYLVKKDNTMHAAGGMIASAPDLANFVITQLNEGRLGSQQVFPAEVIAESQKAIASFEEKRGPYTSNGYGMGWNIGTFEGEPLLRHFGGFAGSNAHISYMPQHDLGVVILMNEGQVAQSLGASIAGYAYDMMRDKEGVDEARRTEVATLAERVKGARVRIAQHQEELAQRTWEMSHAFEAYAGSYSNPLYGTITINQKGPEQLEVMLGNMHAVATPFNKPDSLRLELVPGRGRGLIFSVNKTGVEGLTYDGITYSRD